LEGNGGQGRWMHGSDQPYRVMLTYDTEGCVVLNNQDLMEISPYIDLFETPLIIVQKVKYLPPEDLEPIRKELEQFLKSWETAWESKDLETYMAAYSKKFKSGNMDWYKWKAYKKILNTQYKWINVKTEDVTWFLKERQVVAYFKQFYNSNIHSDMGKKRLYLNQEGVNWKIIGEYWEPLPQPSLSQSN